MAATSRTSFRRRLLEQGAELAELLGVSRDEAVILQRDWREKRKIEEVWFDEDGHLAVRRKVGLSADGMSAVVWRVGLCGLCLEDSLPVARTPGCETDGHQACESCWRQYVQSKISEGRACGRIRCFGLKCRVLLGVDHTLSLLEETDKSDWWTERFWKFYVEEVVEESEGKVRKCPGEDCEWLLRLDGKKNARSSGIRCGGCGEENCGDCGQWEEHRPVSCEELRKWEEKNVSESENCRWILAHTKPCPQCAKPIEKNQGCNHMHCAKEAGGCGKHFCWMCGKDWNSHGGADAYSCNLYAESADMKKREKIREDNKNELNRYLFFFERYNGHLKARGLAKKQLMKVEEKCEHVHTHYGVSVLDLHFFPDALKQILRCRRVLMYSYAFGYFLDDQAAIKPLFEHLQKNLEEKTDKLHEYIEKDFDRQVLNLAEDFFVYKQDPIMDFKTAKLPAVSDKEKSAIKHELQLFRSKVNNLISVVDKFTNAVIKDLSQDALLL